MGDVGATSKKSNKIRDIVRLQQMLKKWKKAATASSSSSSTTNCNASTVVPTTTTTNTSKATTTTKGLNKFLKKTLSFSDISNSFPSSSQEDVAVRKGYLAVWVGRAEEEEMKKFVIPTDYLAHQAFSVLLRDAEEEFGFQQEGILKIPCDVPLFEKILKMMSSPSSTASSTASADNNNNKKQQQQLLKSSSSTSSFFSLYEQADHHQQPTTTAPNSSSQQQQLKTPPTTPTHHLPLYCR